MLVYFAKTILPETHRVNFNFTPMRRITFLPSIFLLVDLVLGGLRVAGTLWGSLLSPFFGSFPARVVLMGYFSLLPWLTLGGAVGWGAGVWDLVGLCVVVVVVGCLVVVVVVLLVVVVVGLAVVVALVVVGLVVVVALVVVVVSVVVARVVVVVVCKVVFACVAAVVVVFLTGCCTTADPKHKKKTNINRLNNLFPFLAHGVKVAAISIFVGSTKKTLSKNDRNVTSILFGCPCVLK